MASKTCTKYFILALSWYTFSSNNYAIYSEGVWNQALILQESESIKLTFLDNIIVS